MGSCEVVGYAGMNPASPNMRLQLRLVPFRRTFEANESQLARYVVSIDNEGGNVNTVTLIGNLVTDVEVRDVGDDKKVANFLLAVDRAGADSDADFVRISAWNRQAEVCAEFLSKGRRVAVEGRLRTSSWEDTEGKKRTAVEIVARSVEFLSGPTREGAAADIPFEAMAAA
jgi:single-strand DNA-binding protein